MQRQTDPCDQSRRALLKVSATGLAAGVAGFALPGLSLAAGLNPAPVVRPSAQPFKISLAQWSLHNALYGGDLDHLDFAKTARETYGIGAIEYVNAFFKDKASDAGYLAQMNTRAHDHGVTQLLIMVDGEGRIGAPSEKERVETVNNHRRWLDAAKALGCHSIRVNAASEGSFDEQQKLAADGLRRLTEIGAAMDLNILVENHGGLSSNGTWLAGVMKMVDHPRCGTLPDFGNFCFDWSKADLPEMWYDRYVGVKEMMPFAKAVSAKSKAFDDNGYESQTDFTRMMKIVTDAGYHGFVGIEWEGKGVSEHEGIMLTKRLLEKVRGEMG